MTTEDHLIQTRLERSKAKAFRACSDLIASRNLPIALVDVEQLFDGKSIYFYYLGEVTSEVEALTDELAQTYESKVRVRDFARLLESGCGPGCGTEASSCTNGGCSTCVTGCGRAS